MSKGLIYLTLLGVLCIFILPLTSYNESVTIQRLMLLTQGSGDLGASANARVENFDVAWRMFEERPIAGYGIGSFPVYYNGNDETMYPHNILLEVASELGILGLSLLLILFAVSLRNILRSKSTYKTVIQAGSMFLFLNSLVSGDLGDNRILFTFLGLMSASPILLYSNTTQDKKLKLSSSKDHTVQ